MKRTQIILSFLGILSISGCTLETPLQLDQKCSDASKGLSAVVYAGMVCRAEDTGPNGKSECLTFADAFKYGHCPLKYACIEDQNHAYICSMTSCLFTQHEHNGQCEENTLLHCGQHGYECEINTAGWIDGYCQNDISGARCFATECEEGYQLGIIFMQGIVRRTA